MDTAANRASSIGICIPWTYLLVPDGTIDQGDRQALAHSYSGILAGEAPDGPESIGTQYAVATNPVTNPVVNAVKRIISLIGGFSHEQTETQVSAPAR